jgi:hypothetical protein
MLLLLPFEWNFIAMQDLGDDPVQLPHYTEEGK